MLFSQPARYPIITIILYLIIDLLFLINNIFDPLECSSASLEVSIEVDICAMYLYCQAMVLLTYYNILYNIRETERNQSHCGSYKQREVCNIIIIYYRIYAARARKFYVVRRWKSQYKTHVQSVNQDSYDCKRVDGRNRENKNEITDKIPQIYLYTRFQRCSNTTEWLFFYESSQFLGKPTCLVKLFLKPTQIVLFLFWIVKIFYFIFTFSNENISTFLSRILF